MKIGLAAMSIIGACLLASGVVLFIWAWQRRRGTDAHCRQCDFSLAGHERPERCPECGTDLTSAKATRRGAPQRARGRVALAVILGLLGVAVLIAGPVMKFQQVTWIDIAPSWWLINVELPGASGTRELALLTELIDRAKAGELSADAKGELVEFALMRQRDNSVVWNPDWFFFIDAAWAAGELDRDQRFAVVRQMIASSFRGDMGTGPGEAQITLELTGDRGRSLGPAWVGARAPNVEVRQEYLELVVDGQSQRVGGYSATTGVLRSSGSSSSFGRILPETFEPGTYPASATVKLTVLDRTGEKSGYGEELGSWTESGTFDVIVLGPEDMPDLEMLFAAIRSVIEVKPLRRDDGTLILEITRPDSGDTVVEFGNATIAELEQGLNASSWGTSSDGSTAMFRWTWDGELPPNAAVVHVQIVVNSVVHDGTSHRKFHEPLELAVPVAGQ